MTNVGLLVEYLSPLADNRPVLVLMPNGDKLACSPTVDADGTVVLVPESAYDPYAPR